MPPKTRNGKNNESESDTDKSDNELDNTIVPLPSPNIAMTENMLQTLVSNITRSQVEANRVLIESILASNRDHGGPSPRPDTRSYSPRSGNLAKCTTRFDGSTKNADELEAFIDAIEVFQECTNISDEHALRGLPMLLVGEAAIWWQGVKSSVTSWTDALQRLRGMYGVPRPAYKIFQDIFATEQSAERADVFISKVRALLAKLPYDVPEVMKLDILYGLLDRRIRKRVTRDTVDGLEQLITRIRLVEESLAEVSTSTLCSNNFSSFVNPIAAARDRSNTNLSVNPANAAGDSPSLVVPTVKSLTDTRASYVKRSDSEGQQKRIRPKCTYCKLFGHTVDNCRNKENKNSTAKVDSDSDESSSSYQLRCYGCDQLGVIRSKCKNCQSAPSSSKSEFCSAHVVDNDDSLPLVEVEVVGRKGVAILDTGASHSIAGPMLYRLLEDAGVDFKKTSRTIGLADGSQQVCTALECYVNVTLKGHVIPTTFLVLPNAQTRTLLGRDFILQACILLDLPQSSWCFNEEPRCWHPFITHFELPTAGDMELMKVAAPHLVLRDVEGTKLKTSQKTQLNDLQIRRADRLAKERHPTEYTTHLLVIDTHHLQGPEVRKTVEGLKLTDDPFRGRGWSDSGTVMSDDILEKESTNGEDPFRGRGWPDRGIVMSDGILYRKSASKKPHRTVKPEHKRENIIDVISNGDTLGRQHVSQLTPFVGDVQPPVNEKWKRGRTKRFLADLDAGALSLDQRGSL